MEERKVDLRDVIKLMAKLKLTVLNEEDEWEKGYRACWRAFKLHIETLPKEGD